METWQFQLSLKLDLIDEDLSLNLTVPIDS